MINAKFKKIGQRYSMSGVESNFTISTVCVFLDTKRDIYITGYKKKYKEYNCRNPFSFVLYAHAEHPFSTLLS